MQNENEKRESTAQLPLFVGSKNKKKHFHFKCSFGRIDGKINQLLCIVVEVKCQQIVKASRSSETHVPNPLSPLEKSPAVLQ